MEQEKLHRERPASVVAAIIRGDHYALRVMATLGGFASQKKRRIKKAKFQQEMLERLMETNEHIIGIDGNDGPCPDGRLPF